jgi:hypothetical protein
VLVLHSHRPVPRAPKLIRTHTFPLAEVPTAIRYARERIEDAIKVVVQIRDNWACRPNMPFRLSGYPVLKR